MSDLHDLQVPFGKVIELITAQVSIAEDDICTALLLLKHTKTEAQHSTGCGHYNQAIDDAIQVIKSTKK